MDRIDHSSHTWHDATPKARARCRIDRHINNPWRTGARVIVHMSDAPERQAVVISEDGEYRVIVKLVWNSRLHNVLKSHCDLCDDASPSGTVGASGTNEED